MEWWWVEYLENEMDPGLNNEVDNLLKSSQEDRLSFEHLRLLREWLKASDPVADWPLDERLAEMRKKVMSEIDRI